jgi:hypothetical protein
MSKKDRQYIDKLNTIYQVAAAALGLISFGLAYAWVVNRLERSGHMENRSSWFVALGTAVTVFVRHALMPTGETRLSAMGYSFLGFVFSGVPMIINQWITKARVEIGFRSRLKDRQWNVSRSGPHTEPR